jgi:hypothetical protein
MNRAICLIKKIKLLQIISLVLLVFTLVAGNHMQALADDSAPVPDYSYQLKLTADNIKQRTHKSGEYLPDNALQNVEKAVDNAREQININETAKNLTDKVKEKASKVVSESKDGSKE